MGTSTMVTSSIENSTYLMNQQNTSYENGDASDSKIRYSRYSEIVSECQTHLTFDTEVSGYIQIVILLTALPVNAALLWLLLKDRTVSSSSSCLSINLSILNLLYIPCLIMKIYTTFQPSSSYLYNLSESLSCLNLVGCPLLLTCMCVERYVAVVWPITYMQANRVHYQIACCAVVWILTLTMGIAFFLIHNVMIYAWCVAVGISILYLLMLLCLGGIIQVLYMNSPGNHEMGNVSVKRKALKNVLAVLVPFTVAYLPVLGLIPLMSVITAETYTTGITTQECVTLQTLITFPCVGIYIGPTFYLRSIVRSLFCQKRPGEPRMPINMKNNCVSVELSQTNSSHHEDVTQL